MKKKLLVPITKHNASTFFDFTKLIITLNTFIIGGIYFKNDTLLFPEKITVLFSLLSLILSIFSYIQIAEITAQNEFNFKPHHSILSALAWCSFCAAMGSLVIMIFSA